MTEGYIFTTRQEDDSDTVPSVALDIDSELLAYAELPAQGAFWARLTDRDVLTENRYTLLLLQGMDAGQHALQQYERQWSGFKDFSQKIVRCTVGKIVYSRSLRFQRVVGRRYYSISKVDN